MSDLPPLSNVIAAHDLGARKSLGQNFLLDLNLTRKIARSGGPLDGHVVLEIGPGPGGLTRALLEEGADRVIAIEMDDRIRPVLAEIEAAFPGRLIGHFEDALKVDELSLLREHGRDLPVRIVANLPYNIASALLVKWLTADPWPPYFESLTLMFQKEVAERIVSAPGQKSYGRLSILSQWRTDAKILFDLPPRAFTPPPKVTSSVVRLDLREKPRGDANPKVLERVVAAAFSQRRKMLRQSLKPLAKDPIPWIEEAGIDPTARAETLSVEDFCRLSRLIET